MDPGRQSEGFLLLGTYPQGSPEVDLLREAPTVDQLRNVDLSVAPPSDPLFGRTPPYGNFDVLFQ